MPSIFKKGDAVEVKYCEELEMPCIVQGLNPWCSQVIAKDGTVIYLYSITGKHKKRGNTTTVTVSEGQLTRWQT